jgi:hypothetical protein
MPGLLSEAWASLVGMRIAAELGYPDLALAEREFWRSLRHAAENSGAMLDFVSPAADSQLFGPCEAKMMDLVEALEADFGTGFMPRFLKITRALKGSESPTIPEILYYFSLAAEADLADRYAAWGLTYNPPPPVDSAELAYRIAEYESLRPTLRLRTHPHGELTLIWNSSTNRLYQLQCAPSLSSDGWANWGEPVRGTGTLNEASDRLNVEQRFYRVVTLPCPTFDRPRT